MDYMDQEQLDKQCKYYESKGIPSQEAVKLAREDQAQKFQLEMARIGSAKGKAGSILEDVLKSANIETHEQNIQKMKLYYPAQVSLIQENNDTELAKTEFHWACLQPNESTKIRLQEAGIQLNGLYGRKPAIFKAFLGSVPRVAKMILSKEEENINALEEALHKSLQSPRSTGRQSQLRPTAFAAEKKESVTPDTDLSFFNCEHVTPFQFHTDMERRKMMIMPCYPANLDELHILDQNIAGQLVHQMIMGIESIHAHGMAHMDIKPTNIAIDSSGKFIIIDLGSVAKFGNPTFSTDIYVPYDLRNSNYVANIDHDFWMLAMTVYHKAAVPGILWDGDEFTRDFLYKKLSKYLPQDAWDLLKSKLHATENAREIENELIDTDID